jgi:peptidoglycan hydrolase-like protein with peptidoglycan-binding domain
LGLSATKILILASTLALSAAYAAAEPQNTATTPSTKPGVSSSKHSSKSHRRSKSRKGAWKRHGQQSIQPERALAIQQALIREKYLSGEPSGSWDARTQEAMSRYQAAHGWQDKVTPDSRALIKLGLGPKYSEKEMLQLPPKPSSDAVTANAASTSPSKQ